MLGFVGFVSSGCIEPFETPSAYADESFLCPDQEAFSLRVEECRAAFDSGGGCGGVLSLRGAPQATDVVLTTDFVSSEFTLYEIGGGTEDPVLARVDASGASPYFFISLQLKGVGGAASAVPHTDVRTLTFDASTSTGDVADDRLEVGLRISNGSESVDLVGRTDEGTLTIEGQGRDELAGTFEGAFGEPDDFVEGCFHVFPLETRTRR